ncbi:MAG: transporter substrate-binding domain-containing protein [Bacteroidota bacterium]
MRLKRRKYIYVTGLFFLLIFTAACEPQETEKKELEKINEVEVDWPRIQERGTLEAITRYGSTSYFLYRGQPMGYGYDLVSRMAESMGLDLEIVIAEDLNKEIEMLRKGRGDIIIHGLTITGERKELITFTQPHTTTHQVLVQKKPENWRQMNTQDISSQLVSDLYELIGKKVHVRRNSSYYARLKNIEEELGGNINIVEVPGNLTTEDLIKKVAEGEISYTVSDYNLAAINQTYYQNLDIGVRLSFSQRVAWGIRESSPRLLTEVNKWIEKMKQQVDYYVIYNKYFKHKKSYMTRIRSDFFSMEGGRISRYDDLVQKYADNIGWDWRLITSQMYQESNFNPRTTSWAGARGLMQLMPPTARELGIGNLYNAENSIRAGTKYINYLEDRWSSIPDSIERVKFVLGSYNVGFGHVQDAQRLAEKESRNSKSWGVIEDYLLKLSKPAYYNDPVVKYGYCKGEEPYYYVRQILKRFDHYKRFVN